MRLRKLLAIANKQQAVKLRQEMNYIALFKLFEIESPRAKELAREILKPYKQPPHDTIRKENN